MPFDFQQALAAATSRGESPFDVVMPNGKKLGDCTGNDLKEFAKMEMAHAKALRRQRQMFLLEARRRLA